MMLQACVCPWSLNVPSPLCHGIKADYHQPQVLLNPGRTSSRSTGFLGISLWSAATGTGSGQHTPPQGLQMVPSTLISATAAALKDTFQTQVQCTEACSVMSMLVKFLSRQHEAPELLCPQCEIQPHTVGQTALSVRKKWISHFRRQSSKQSLTKTISLFLFWKLSIAIIWISVGAKMFWLWFRKACPWVCPCHGLPTFSATCHSLLTWAERTRIWVSI